MKNLVYENSTKLYGTQVNSYLTQFFFLCVTSCIFNSNKKQKDAYRIDWWMFKNEING